MCKPSQINSTVAPLSKAAPTTPGARCKKEGIPLNRWVAWLAPARKDWNDDLVEQRVQECRESEVRGPCMSFGY